MMETLRDYVGMTLLVILGQILFRTTVILVHGPWKVRGFISGVLFFPI